MRSTVLVVILNLTLEGSLLSWSVAYFPLILIHCLIIWQSLISKRSSSYWLVVGLFCTRASFPYLSATVSELSALVYFIDAVLFTLAVGSVIFFGLEDVSENWRRAMEKQGLAESKFRFLLDNTEPAATNNPGHVESIAEPASYANTAQSTILVVEDNSDLLNLCTEILEAEGHRVLTATTGKAALETVTNNTDIDVIVLAYSLPDGTGPDVYRTSLERNFRLPLIFCTGFNIAHIREELDST